MQTMQHNANKYNGPKNRNDFLKVKHHIFLLICGEMLPGDNLDMFREIHLSVNFDTLSPGIIYAFNFLKVSQSAFSESPEDRVLYSAAAIEIDCEIRTVPPHTVPVREKNWKIYVSKVIWENMVQFCHGKLKLTAGPFFTGKSADFCSRMQFWAASSSFFAAPDGQGRCPTLTQEKKTHPPLTLLLFWKVPSRPSLIWQSEEVLLIGTAKSNCDWN